VQAGGTRANEHNHPPSSRRAHAVDQVDQVRRVYRSCVLSIVSLPLLLFQSPAQAASEGGPGASRYAISVPQMKVPAKVSAYLSKARLEFSKMDLPAAGAEVERALGMDPECAQAFTMRAFI
jgi:hypothetical protein